MNSLSRTEYRKFLDNLTLEYEIGEPSVTDEAFDSYIKYYEKKFKTRYKGAGALPPGGIKVKLPYYTGGINLLKGENLEEKIEKWKDKHPLYEKVESDEASNGEDEYIIMRKVDGNAAVLISDPGIDGEPSQTLV
jgi:hypothetical protein